MAIKDEDGSEILHHAAKKGHADQLVTMKQCHEKIPIYWAAEKGHHCYCKVMMETGVSPRAQDINGKSPIDTAQDALEKATGALVEATSAVKKATEDKAAEPLLKRHQASVATTQASSSKLQSTVAYLRQKIQTEERAGGLIHHY
ncbi:uncharacterized protein BCR38DRAFT_406844 [Pseudomassariella vexata]|uniref:Uncharacterized protein n=1 Tax=Pseudomassariella vexata TaxID=1141098 RepID=A0A1Y2EC37_9PEZI|nr:uncharacterized protein BCR38DRAFT_406844 [Pseudomassariella vexata]ORY68967.1 hypothetical protein BCR38DRAFT_406844 [Pseudomassariella vexata]